MSPAVRIDAHTVQEIQQGGVGGDGKEGVLVRDGEVGGEGGEGVAVVAEEGEGMIFFLAALTEIRAGKDGQMADIPQGNAGDDRDFPPERLRNHEVIDGVAGGIDQFAVLHGEGIGAERVARDEVDAKNSQHDASQLKDPAVAAAGGG